MNTHDIDDTAKPEPKGPSTEDLTRVTTHDDGRFIRTAIQPQLGGEGGGSIDILGRDGERVCQINIFTYDHGAVIVDVIDVDRRYDNKRALVDPGGEHRQPGVPVHYLVSADFRNAS